MRRKTKQMAAVFLTVAACGSMAACSGDAKETTAMSTQKEADSVGTEAAKESTAVQKDSEDQVEKPEKITVMMNGTVFSQANGRDAFEKALEEKLGLDIEFQKPDHAAYYDNVAMTFAGGDIPDVILLGGSYYLSYAKEGALWDMTETWENSDLAKSGREINQNMFESLKVDGKVYGFYPSKNGGGCVTYIKKKWLDNVGLEEPTTWEEYNNVLKAFTEGDPDGNGVNGDTFGVTAAGLIASEEPWVMYLPEFYQDAFPEFYQNEDGVWVDGFGEDKMVKALDRMQGAYQAGYIDKEILTNKTSDCRNKFYDDKCGVFTYWSGTWAYNLKSNLEAKGLDSELIALAPIKEVGTYKDRFPGSVWCITSECKNPEGVFKYFLEPMLDGGDVQVLWTYGVKGVHWDDKAETVKYGDKEETHEEGVFHMLPNAENPTTLNTKNHIDPMGAGATYIDKDPGIGIVNPIARECQEKYDTWQSAAPQSPATSEVYNALAGDLRDMRGKAMTEVVLNGASAQETIDKYNQDAKSIVEEILADLNK